MDGKERRIEILNILKKSSEPVPGSELARRLNVSRQIIVQDIALIRAINRHVLSTTRGYVLYYQEDEKINRCYMVKHNCDQMLDELCTMVDFGGKVLDVIVVHELYGSISVDLMLSNRQEVYDFCRKMEEKKAAPLMSLTDEFHFHTVEADSDATLDKIEKALNDKGYLVK